MLAELAGADAQPASSGSPTCGRSAPRTGSASRACAELAERHGARAAATGDGRDPRLRRAAHPRRARGAPRRRELRAEDVLEGGDGDIRRARCRSRRRSRGLPRARLRRQRPRRSTGNLNCPLSVTKAACFFAVRVVCDPGRAALGRRLAAGRRSAPPRDRCSTPAARPRSSAATSRPRAASRTWSSPRSPALAPVPAPGPGDDEQPDARRRGLDLLRDDRRRPGRLPGRRRAERRSTWRCRTPSTRRSRRSRPSSRCGSASSRCGAAAAAAGRHRGGDGIVRELEALEPMRFTLIGERRRHAPHGRDGGGAGGAGPRPAQRRAARAEERGRARAGDRLRIETPGGGGYGAEPNRLVLPRQFPQVASIGRSTRTYTAWEWAIRYLQLSL